MKCAVPRSGPCRNAVTLFLVLAAAACAESHPAIGPAASSQIDAPLVDLTGRASFQGEAKGEAPYQLAGVRAALRLPDGRVVVLDGLSRELRFFDSAGRHISSTGGRGDGPGEFQNPWTMYRRADTLFVVDIRTKMLSLFDLDGAFIGTKPGDHHGSSGNAFLYDASIVVAAPDGMRPEESGDLIRKLPRPSGYVREVRLAGGNGVWLRSDASSTEWIAFDGTGSAIRRLRLPERFALHEVGAGYVLGVLTDSLDVESVHVIDLPDTVADGRGRSMMLPVPSAAEVAALREVLTRVEQYQEYFYSRPDGGYTFARSIEELAAFEPPPAAGLQPLSIPPELLVRITSGGELGWFGVVADTTRGTACGSGQLNGAPGGWTTGAPACFRSLNAGKR